jgi:hypothetical protein
LTPGWQKGYFLVIGLFKAFPNLETHLLNSGARASGDFDAYGVRAEVRALIRHLPSRLVDEVRKGRSNAKGGEPGEILGKGVIGRQILTAEIDKEGASLPGPMRSLPIQPTPKRIIFLRIP